ncbi:hypothetical protein [Aurantimonas phage AmM-1]|uniref:hypothetical protein n=1 Tax=Aurantimonas phage AmM-1 TaxID=1503929 RepID=UPI000540B1F1|nr:hypothetical protein ACQ23_gp42 [Aurantimonas phage AmM-1]BAP94499.1 hypothetical protein [Aurantimonas phage AmM-1]
MSVNWGYILEGAGRPPLKSQRTILGIANVDMSEYGAAWQDRLPPRATRPRTALPGRELLLKAIAAGDFVHVVDMLCLGVSEPDVEWFVAELQARGVTLVVHGGVKALAPDEDASELVKEFGQARHALHMRRYRARKS